MSSAGKQGEEVTIELDFTSDRMEKWSDWHVLNQLQSIKEESAYYFW